MIVPSDGEKRNLIHCFNVTLVRVGKEGGERYDRDQGKASAD